MSYQTEERFWTDYVRVATPIVGLLLLLGVFWYWASSLIGADSETPPPTVTSITVIPDPTATPTPTEEAPPPEDTPEATEEPTEEPEEEPEPTRTPRTATEEPEEEPTEEPSCGDFEEGQVIFSADNDVNMRAEPTTESEAIEVLTLNQPLTVLDCEPVENGGFVWWNVENEDSGNRGWVVQDWLKTEQ